MHPPFDWTWHPHPEAWAIAGTILAWYFWMLRRRRAENPMSEPATKRQRKLFVAGTLVLLVAGEWPIHDLAEGYLYSLSLIHI